MNANDLQVSSHTARKRVGRGISAGGGKTAGRGTKGQNSRSGGQRNPGFEGGQTPLYQRLPKLKGFRSHRAKSQIIHTSDLAKLSATKLITLDELVAAGLVASKRRNTKLLYDADPAKAYKVSLPLASAKAVAALESAGGSFTATPVKLLEKLSTVEREPKPRPPRRAKRAE